MAYDKLPVVLHSNDPSLSGFKSRQAACRGERQLNSKVRRAACLNTSKTSEATPLLAQQAR